MSGMLTELSVIAAVGSHLRVDGTLTGCNHLQSLPSYGSPLEIQSNCHFECGVQCCLHMGSFPLTLLHSCAASIQYVCIIMGCVTVQNTAAGEVVILQ